MIEEKGPPLGLLGATPWETNSRQALIIIINWADRYAFVFPMALQAMCLLSLAPIILHIKYWIFANTLSAITLHVSLQDSRIK